MRSGAKMWNLGKVTSQIDMNSQPFYIDPTLNMAQAKFITVTVQMIEQVAQ